MTPLRILIPCHFPLEGSGSGVYVRNVARELIARGHAVSILAPAHPAHAAMGLPIDEITFGAGGDVPFELPSFTTHPVSNKTFEKLTAGEIDQYVAVYRERVGRAIAEFRPSVVHAQHVWVAAACAASAGARLVTTCHGTDVMGFRDCPAFRAYAHAAVAGSAEIIAVSRQVGHDLGLIADIDLSKIHVIHNGVHTTLFQPRAMRLDDLLADLEIDVRGDRAIAFAGKLTWFKGADLLVQAAAMYEYEAPGLVTLVAGGGELRDDLIALAKGLGLERVVFLGPLPHERLPDVFNAADLTCVPSRGEPFGLVALESMACGTPVVGFRTGGLPEFVTPERGALVADVSAHALAEAILGELAADAKSVKGPTAAAYAREERSWPHVVDEVIHVYEQAIAEARP